jgi:hypothetical protein
MLGLVFEIREHRSSVAAPEIGGEAEVGTLWRIDGRKADGVRPCGEEASENEEDGREGDDAATDRSEHAKL